MSGGRRDEILRRAAELFAERGYAGVSVDDLGAAAGVSGPALYRHFPSKEAILEDLLLDISRSLVDEGRRRAAVGAGEDAVAPLVDGHVEFALSRPALITVQSRDLASLPPSSQRMVRRLQRQYVDLWVDAIVARYGAGRAEALAAAHVVFGLINSTPHSARLPHDAMRRLLRDMALAALSTLRRDPPGGTRR